MQRRMPLLVHDADARGDRYASLYLRGNFGNASWLFADEVDEAARELDAAFAGWTGTTFDAHPMSELVARTSLDLYRGDGASAHHRIREGKAVFTRTSNAKIQLVRISLMHLAGRAALAASRSGGDRPSLLAESASVAARIERERVPWGTPLAELLRAGIAPSAAIATARSPSSIAPSAASTPPTWPSTTPSPGVASATCSGATRAPR